MERLRKFIAEHPYVNVIRYCLTTNRNFNALCNKKSGRTLQGSVHAKQRKPRRLPNRN